MLVCRQFSGLNVMVLHDGCILSGLGLIILKSIVRGHHSRLLSHLWGRRVRGSDQKQQTMSGGQKSAGGEERGVLHVLDDFYLPF